MQQYVCIPIGIAVFIIDFLVGLAHKKLATWGDDGTRFIVISDM